MNDTLSELQKASGKLRAVLCDPEGTVCIDGSSADRAEIQEALAIIDKLQVQAAEPVALYQVRKISSKDGKWQEATSLGYDMCMSTKEWEGRKLYTHPAQQTATVPTTKPSASMSVRDLPRSGVSRQELIDEIEFTLKIPRESWGVTNMQQLGAISRRHTLLKFALQHLTAAPSNTATVQIDEMSGCTHMINGTANVQQGYEDGTDLAWCKRCGSITWASDGLIEPHLRGRKDYTEWKNKNVTAWSCSSESNGRGRCRKWCGHQKACTASLGGR